MSTDLPVLSGLRQRSRLPAAPAPATDVIGEYEPAQRDHARRQITDAHRHLVARLLSGDLDPL